MCIRDSIKGEDRQGFNLEDIINVFAITNEDIFDAYRHLEIDKEILVNKLHVNNEKDKAMRTAIKEYLTAIAFEGLTRNELNIINCGKNKSMLVTTDGEGIRKIQLMLNFTLPI